MKKETNFNQTQINKMLSMVASKMGKTPEQLEQELKQGNYPTEVVNDFSQNNDLGEILKSGKLKDLLK